VGGTFGTVAAAGLLIHYAFGLSWYVTLLVATAVAPTDPAVVFSVLGSGRYPVAAAPSWRASLAVTTRSASR